MSDLTWTELQHMTMGILTQRVKGIRKKCESLLFP